MLNTCTPLPVNIVCCKYGGISERNTLLHACSQITFPTTSKNENKNTHKEKKNNNKKKPTTNKQRKT
jgi:hypothetical protein